MLLVPAGSHYHFGCVFGVKTPPLGADGWAQLIKLIRKWVCRNYPDETAFMAKWWFLGGELQPRGAPHVLVKTAIARGAGPQERPEYWGLRYEHPCSEVARRQWRTEITVSALSPDTYRISVAVVHRMISTFMGTEPPAPMPTAPSIVANILSVRGWIAKAGSETLRSTFEVLDARGIAELPLRLEDPNRRCPLVLISCSRRANRPLLDPRRLGRLLAGNAGVLVAPTLAVQAELDVTLPFAFRCPDGMVRVYQPGVRLSVDADARHHRFFTRDEIVARTPVVVEDDITRSIIQGARVLDVRTVASLDDVIAKQREMQREELQKNAQRNQQELEELFTLDNEALKSEISSLRVMLEQESTTRSDAELQVTDLERERIGLRQRALTAEERVRQLEAQNGAIGNLKALPASLPEVMSAIGSLWPGRIVFTERAKRSAADAQLNSVPAEIRQAWRCVWAVATDLHDIVFNDVGTSGDPAQEFRARTGFEVAFTEGKQTKRDPKVMRARKDKFEGQDIDLTAHVKYGSTPPKCLRIHFHVDNDNGRFIIGHCGDHLETAGTRRRS